MNPFSHIVDEKNEIKIRDNEDMHKKMCTWSLENVNTLSLKSIASKINELLVPYINEDPSFLTNRNLSFPVKLLLVSRWIDDLEF